MAVDKAAEDVERRGFLTWLWRLLVAVGLAELGGILYYFFKTRRTRAINSSGEAIVNAGRVDEYQPNSVTAFQMGGFYLIRLVDGGFLALSRQCTHLGCTVPWNDDDKKFECPCHASVFDISGNVLKSPASRALDLHPLTIEGGMVKVDSGRRIKRSEFRPEQVVYPPKQK